jgi:arylsulfatase A-like enzyme
MRQRFQTVILVILVFVFFVVPLRAQSPDDSPNVILIIADQMRGDAMSIMDNPNARTPNLDRMAESGVLFENFYTNNPVCVPTRISFFSGQYPHEHGNLANIDAEFIATIGGTLPDYFQEQGYRLGYIGKNHTFEDGVFESFDYVELRGREPFRTYNKYVPPYWHGDMYWPKEHLYATRTTDDAREFLDGSDGDRPFFLVLSYFDPHPPYFAPVSYAERYSAEEMQVPDYVPPEQLNARLDEQQRALHYDDIPMEDLRAAIKYYHASVEWGIDHQVGEVLDALEKHGITDDTIVLFTAEHGDFMGDHHMVRKGMFLYDALLRVPGIWYAPGRIERGLRTKAMAQTVDIFPTLVDMTGGEISGGFSGRSLKPILTGEAPGEWTDRAVFASAAYSDLPEGYFDDPEQPFWDPPEDTDVPFHSRVEDLTWQPEQRTAMIRTGEWKLILNETRGPELYHMDGGWTERENVADDPGYENVMERLRARLEDVWTW